MEIVEKKDMRLKENKQNHIDHAFQLPEHPEPVDLRAQKASESKPQVDTMTEYERKLRYQKSHDREMVTGIFRDLEVKGGEMKFPFRKWKGDTLATYEFVDGEVKTIPRMVAEHLNNNCKYPIYKAGKDNSGKAIDVIDRYVHRFSFQSLDFSNTNGYDAAKSLVS